MKKLDSIRTTTQVTIATITTTNVILLRDPILSIMSNNGSIDIGNILLFSALLTIYIYLIYLLFNFIITQAFNSASIRKKILGQDYIEGYWLVHNSIGGEIVSVGCVKYELIHEQLLITGTHYKFDNNKKIEPIRSPSSLSIKADCFHGRYYNYFEIPHIGHGLARGFFNSRAPKGKIPDTFEVQVITTSSPERVFRWGKESDKHIKLAETSFTSLSASRKKEIVKKMADYKVVTMDQKGKRLLKKDFKYTCEYKTQIDYKTLVKEHYDKLIEESS